MRRPEIINRSDISWINDNDDSDEDLDEELAERIKHKLYNQRQKLQVCKVVAFYCGLLFIYSICFFPLYP